MSVTQSKSENRNQSGGANKGVVVIHTGKTLFDW